MSETILTKGWAPPKGKCDECRTNEATRWFGDTSVALCNEPKCWAVHQQQWDQMIQSLENPSA